MNQEYDDTNKGVLFRVYEKKTDKHPDYTGSVDVDGKKFWLNGWKNTSKSGSNYLSISIQPKIEKLEGKPVTDEDIEKPINLDEIPF